MEQYRLEYKVIQSDHTGNGSWYDSEQFIKDHVDHLNKKYYGIINHWVGKKKSKNKI